LASKVAQSQQTPQHLETLALSLAETGRCEEAVQVQKELVALAEKLGNEKLTVRLRIKLIRYEAGAPCRTASEDATAESPAKVQESTPEPKQDEAKADAED